MSTVSSNSWLRDMDVPPIFSTVWDLVVKCGLRLLDRARSDLDRALRLAVGKERRTGLLRGKRRFDPVGPGVIDKERVRAREGRDVAVRAMHGVALEK